MKNSHFGKWGIALLLTALVFTFVMTEFSYTQTTVTLKGVVTDQDGGPLPGVTIDVKNRDTGYVYSTITRSDGQYLVATIQPGRYTIELSLSGFATLVRKGLTFQVGSTLTINFTLSQATLEEEVTVIGESPMVEVTKSEISSVVGRKVIDDLPLYDRDFGSLTVMKPGVAGGRTAAQPVGSGEFLIDGVSNEIVGGNSVRTRIPADAIQEYRVITNQMQAQYGNASGMVQSAITRSGTNDFRGRVSFFYRDQAFDAVNYFVNHAEYQGPELDKSEYESPEFEHYNFGGFLGGPIVKDKFHFFIAYDGLRHTDYSVVTSPLVDEGSVKIPNNTDQILLKLNYQPTEQHLITFRFSHDNYRLPENGGVGGYRTISSAYTYDRPMSDFQVNWTFYPSDNTVNEVRLLYSHADQNAQASTTEYAVNRPSGYFGSPGNYPQQQVENRYNIVNHFSLFAGNHTLKFGADYAYTKTTTDIWLYKPGIYVFATDAPFDPTNFATYPTMLLTNREENTIFVNPLTLFGIFIQDSWRIHPQLTINLGLRYNYYDAPGFFINHGSIKNFNPRFGFSWDPVGDGKTQIRGGIGTYSANMRLNSAQITSIMGAMQIQAVLFPNYPDPSTPNPFFPFDFAVDVPLSKYSSIEGQIPPYTIQATLGAQREVLPNFTIGLDLVWAGGRHIMRLDQLNPVIPGTGNQRPDPTTGDHLQTTDFGKTDYRGLYFTLTKRYSNGWSLDVAYTLGRALSHLNNQENVYPDTYEPDNWDRQYGPVDRDARHRLAVSGIVDLPAGFQVSGIFYYRSKYPWNAVYAADLNLDSLPGDYVDQQRNSRRGFDSLYLNLRISKFFTFDQFRIHPFVEVYNVTNRVNFTSVDPYIDGTRFGEPTAASNPRLIQLGIRVEF